MAPKWSAQRALFRPRWRHGGCQTVAPMRHAILLHPAAPAKPAIGASCNGCGQCCALQPCPLGMVVSRRWHGGCAALHWDEPAQRYRCGMVDEPTR